MSQPQPSPHRRRGRQAAQPVTGAEMDAAYVRRMQKQHGEPFLRAVLRALGEDAWCPFRERLLAVDVGTVPLESVLAAYRPPLLWLRVLRSGASGRTNRADVTMTWTDEDGRTRKMRFRLRREDEGAWTVHERTALMNV